MKLYTTGNVTRTRTARPRPNRRIARKHRDDLEEVSDAARLFRTQVLDAHRDHLTKADLAVALAVEQLVMSWTRLGDRVSRSKIAEMARVSERTVTDSMGRLTACTSLVWEPGAKGVRRSYVGLVPSSEIPDLSPASVTCEPVQTVADSGKCDFSASVPIPGSVTSRNRSRRVSNQEGGAAEHVEQAQPVTALAALPNDAQHMTTAELVAALAEHPGDPGEIERVAAKIEQVSTRARHHLTTMLRGGQRWRYPGQVRAAVMEAAKRDNLARYNRPECPQCAGARMMERPDGTATRCPSCNPGTESPSTTASPPSSKVAPQPVTASSPTPSAPPSTPLGSPEHVPPSMLPADAAGIEQARGRLTRSSPPVSTILATSSVSP